MVNLLKVLKAYFSLTSLTYIRIFTNLKYYKIVIKRMQANASLVYSLHKKHCLPDSYVIIFFCKFIRSNIPKPHFYKPKTMCHHYIFQ
jgi:hypothetical protein